MKPRKRISYWVFLVVIACAALPSALPYLKDSVPTWVFAILGALGVIAQHIKQEVTANEQPNSEPVEGDDRTSR